MKRLIRYFLSVKRLKKSGIFKSAEKEEEDTLEGPGKAVYIVGISLLWILVIYIILISSLKLELTGNLFND